MKNFPANSPGCVFCSIIKKEIPAKIVFEDDWALVIEDIKPKAPIHLLAIPKIHIRNLSEAEDDMAPISKLMLTIKKTVQDKILNKTGYRVVINCGKDAGQEVEHLHVHILAGRKFNWPPG